jgi:nitroreductase
MDFKKLTEARRSVRKFKQGTEITDEQIRELIETTLKAPSWKNTETGRYYVALSPQKVDEVSDKCLPPFNQTNAHNAGALIVTTFYKGLAGFSPNHEPTNEIGNGWGMYDLGIQNAYLILKAKDMGLDTLIMGIRNASALREIFKIPDNEVIVSVIALGKRAADPVAPVRKKVEEVCRVFR